MTSSSGSLSSSDATILACTGSAIVSVDWTIERVIEDPLTQFADNVLPRPDLLRDSLFSAFQSSLLRIDDLR